MRKIYINLPTSLVAGWALTSVAVFAVPAAARADIRLAADSVAGALGLRGRLPDSPNTFHVVEPRLNGDVVGPTIVIYERSGVIWLPVEFLGLVRIAHSGSTETLVGKQYVSSKFVAASSVRLAGNGTQLDIACNASCFAPTQLILDASSERKFTTITPGLFVNYDIFSQFGDTGETIAGFAETGIFTPAGTGLANLFCSSADGSSTCTRLDTSWTIDHPKTTARLRLGDSVSAAAPWAAPVRFGGVRWGTDFSLNPEYLTFPTPSLNGEATVPGTVSVLINATERFQGKIDAGPFSITDLPVVTGAGTAEAVVTDVVGRETVVSTRFYAAPQLLRRGLSDFSMEAGWLRENFGTESHDYGAPFLAGGYSRGLSDTLTAGVRSEISDGLVSAGLSVGHSNTRLGVTEGSFAMSDALGALGSRWELSHEYRSRALTIGSQIAYTSGAFHRIGEARQLPRTSARAFFGWDVGSAGTASLNWVGQNERIGENYSAFGLGWTSRFRSASIALSAVRITRPDDAFLAALTVSMPLGAGHGASAGLDMRHEELGTSLRLRKSAPVSGGLGYNAAVEVDRIDRYDAGLRYRTSAGDFAVDVSDVDGQQDTRFSVRGGLAYLDNEVVLAPSITNSMAVVTLEGESGVRVYHDRQLAGVTNRRGKLVIPDVRNYEGNIVSFEPTDLSLTADFGTTELEVTPGYRTGHVVDFHIRHQANVIALIVDDHGLALETGTVLREKKSGAAFIVGTDGRVFIPDVRGPIRLMRTKGSAPCEAAIDLPVEPSDEPIRNLGTIDCHGLLRMAPA